MKFDFLGGAMEVGGSCIYVRIAGYGILLDSGIRQGGAKDPLPDFRTIQLKGGLDAILISHAHMDHIGTLPIISKAYPMAKIYMTNMTMDLTRVLLYDSLKIMDRREDEIPHYSQPDVESMLKRIRPLRYQVPFEILEGVRATFYPAGHIAGASCISLQTGEGSLFYSGDVSSFAQKTIEGAKIPKLRPDVAILEATYGNRLHSNRQAEEHRLVELVSEYVKKDQKVLIPAFALGRAQEVLLILRSAIQNGELPRVPVYVDGMVRDINTMYLRNPLFLKNALAKRIWKGNDPFYTEEIRAVKPGENREELINAAGAAVFVSSSGMLTGGPSTLYAKRLLPREESCVILTGYQDEESPGRALLKLLEEKEERSITLDGAVIPVKCNVTQVGLSAHGDKSELSALMERLAPRHIFLVHGDGDAIGELGRELSSDYRRHVYLPQCGESLELNLVHKRRQLSFTLQYTLQRKEQFEAGHERTLWEYWREHYPDKTFTIAQAAFLWYGKDITDEGQLQQFQEILSESPYFSADAKRMFLFKANTEEVVREQLAPRSLTVQELETLIRGLLQEEPVKKISFYPVNQSAVVSFDFPDSRNRETLERYAESFLQQTGWQLSYSAAMNHHAAGALLEQLFQDRLQKLSYYEAEKRYVVDLTSPSDKDTALAEDFLRATGWRLLIRGSLTGEERADGACFFCPKQEGKEMEQNLALSSVETCFAGQKTAPYRKGIKTDSHGRFLELGFLSPALGIQNAGLLQELADRTGWRIHISESVNQNELIRIMLGLCKKYEIPVYKNPSYLPGKKAVQIRFPAGSGQSLPEELKQEFLMRTGCECMEA